VAPRLLHDGINQLISELAGPAPIPENLMGLLGSPVIAEAVAAYYTGPDAFFGLLRQVTTGLPRSPVVSSTPNFTPLAVRGKPNASKSIYGPVRRRLYSTSSLA
jgi:hypothetical protein